MKAIRGAITVDNNTKEDIFSQTTALLNAICTENNLSLADIVAVIFSATRDLDKAYPAEAARAMGFSAIPLFCTQEMNVVGSLPMCVRVLLLTNQDFTKVKHVYLDGASVLRKDL